MLQRKNKFIRLLNLSKPLAKGIYIHGISGSGKTTITSRFFKDKKDGIYMHFNDYFADITRLLQKYNYKQIAELLANKTNLICFDELFIESIADAKILLHLFKELFKRNIFFVVTSNFAPCDLFLGGFNRGVVFPEFSDLLTKHLSILEVNNHFTDHREASNKAMETILFDKEQDFYERLHWFKIFEGLKPESLVDSNINSVLSKEFKPLSKIVLIDYQDLFKKPISIKNMMRLARCYHLVAIKNMEHFNSGNEDEAMRFRDLIDTLYLRGVNVIMLLQKPCDKLICKSLLHKKEFIRTQSRLKEMQWKDYIENQDNFDKRNWSDKARATFEEL